VSYFSHLECSVPCGAPLLDPRERHHLCSCGAPLLARYDLAAASDWSRSTLLGREPTMWRYRELMPLFDGEEPVTLGEGFTPLVHAHRLGATVGLDKLFVKDESLNPTNSFKARGQSAAVTRAKYLGATTLSVPSAGNAGNALAAYAACAGLHAKVFLPRDVKPPFERECVLYGADVTLVDGLITDAGRIAAERGAPLGWYDVSTLKEPYRIEGKKTMAFELAEQLEWSWPDWIIYPTGGGTGMVGMWKAFDELEQIGWMPKTKRPRMVSVQADGCAPIVRAFESGTEKAAMWEHASTLADGLRVPRAIGDFLILRAIRESGGTAVSVSDQSMIDGMIEIGSAEGISAAPEGGAALAAIRRLVENGTIRPNESVVLFNTGGALKYLDVLSHRTSPQATLR
jgi:threonine synthase